MLGRESVAALAYAHGPRSFILNDSIFYCLTPMAHNFFGFSPESFEQFIRALSLQVFGPGVTVFGNGPDGGREAIFNGKVPYPFPPATEWDGYGVIQAKCKEKSESTNKDQAWALAQLEAELVKFQKSTKRTPKPAYYVFATNVELSSGHGGAKDKADAILRAYAARLRLKGHAIWDGNQITGFLTNYETLRKRFIVFLTANDVLAEMLAHMTRQQPNTTRILTTFLDRELRADEASRLDQAGNRTDDQLRLARLFFDLPTSTEPQLTPPIEGNNPKGEMLPGIMSELLRAGSRKLDPLTLYEQETSTSDKAERFPSRFVLLGGPGSGKSTIGQFLAQIHRAALLARGKQHLLEPQSRKIIEETQQLCEQEKLLWPATPRYPFRVELNHFAKALASKDADHVSSLEQYLLRILKSENRLSHEELLEWLTIYPWLIILDGLDEVPATSNRADVIKAIENFLAIARQNEADIFILATTRLQGYAGEFSGGLVALRHVLPLSTARALRYVERYAQARYGVSDPHRATEIVEKLRTSAKRPLTAQLMSSPLQVTFMATVVAARGDPGEDRWQLFDSYYRTIYDRERQKAVPPYDIVLSKQQLTIDRLHHDIGFILQYEGEVAGGTSVTLPIARFEKLVDLYLSEVGREGQEKQTLIKLVTEAARDRLVFLTSRLVGELSFDVRSLQEYMAAECITTGLHDLVRLRMRAIAPAQYWRNVFLFATSKCFVDARSRHLQDPIRLLCEDLNVCSDAFLSSVKAGSELALDILLSGAVSENPNHARHLARLAIHLVAQSYLTHESSDGATADQRLSVAYRDELRSIYKENIELYIGQKERFRTYAAWSLLLRLNERNITWAKELIEKHWPSDTESQCDILEHIATDLGSTIWLRNTVFSLFPKIPQVRGRKLQRFKHLMAGTDCVSSLLQLLSSRGDTRIPLGKKVHAGNGLGLSIQPAYKTEPTVSALWESASRMQHANLEWLPFILAGRFLKSPEHKTLAQILSELADAGWNSGFGKSLQLLPWPLAECLSSIETVDQLKSLAGSIDRGERGTGADWALVEGRWRLEGLDLETLVQGSSNESKILGTSGGPKSFTSSVLHKKHSSEEIRAIFEAARKTPVGLRRDSLLWFLFTTSAMSGGLAKLISPAELRALLEVDTRNRKWEFNCVEYPTKRDETVAWIELFDWLGSSDLLGIYRESLFGDNKSFDDYWSEPWQKAIIAEKREGLIRLLGRLSLKGYVFSLIPLSFLDIDKYADQRAKFAVLLIRLSYPDLTELEAGQLASKAIQLIGANVETEAHKLLFTALDLYVDRVPSLVPFVLSLKEEFPAGTYNNSAKCDRILRKALTKRASDLRQGVAREDLQLPN